ncbi:MAG: efflux RND transporter periplasmic adaptor subunit [Alphaproteobacteria bacterium]|nr:MAG: efflux RND transporter periplasmic adaptor subunit [Alphaproteobacteria bacterium]
MRTRIHANISGKERILRSLRHLLTSVLTLAIAGMLIGGAISGAHPGRAGSAAAQEQQVQGTPVRVDAVVRMPLSQTVPVIGRLVAQRIGPVAARIGGPVAEFRVEVGDRVETGQIIARLDDAVLRAERDIAAGRLTEATALEHLKRSELALARQEYARLERLKASAAFNQARFEDAAQRVAIAEAALKQAQSAIAAARADLKLAELHVAYATVRAPYAGVVSERLTELGAYVSAGDPVVRLVGDQNLEVEAEVPFQHLSGLDAGVEVAMTLDDGSRHSAVVRAVLPAENPLTRTRTVRLVPNFGPVRQPLAHQQSVTLQVPLGPERRTLTVHKDAIVKRRGQDIVFVVVDATAQPRIIDLGLQVGSRIEVRKGLSEGELVVVRGNERLKPGQRVRIVGSDS